MAVKVRPYRRGGWEVDITFRLPNGHRHRERSRAPVSSKSGAQRWGEDRERHLLVHLIPQLGTEALDRITTDKVQLLKQHLAGKAAKTVNNVLAVLNVLLKVAVDWGVIAHKPCAIRLVRVATASAHFHDVDAYDRLLQAAQRISAQTYTIVLLGGDAGLRCGEMWRSSGRTSISGVGS